MIVVNDKIIVSNLQGDLQRGLYIVTCWVGNTSNNLRILDLMPDLLVMRQTELQSIITIAVSL
jgi:hypothetical protein